MTGKVDLYVVQRKLRGSSEWTFILSYPGGKHVGVTPSLADAQALIECERGGDGLFTYGAEYRILKMVMPCEVVQ